MTQRGQLRRQKKRDCLAQMVPLRQNLPKSTGLMLLLVQVCIQIHIKTMHFNSAIQLVTEQLSINTIDLLAIW